jgi:hypothetical protein
VELVAGLRIRLGRLALAGVAAAVILAMASNTDDLRNGAHDLRDYADFVQPGLGALELARGTVDPEFRPEPTRAPDIEAAKYFSAADRFGSPADSPKEIMARTEVAREAADIVLFSALDLALQPPDDAGPGATPAVTLTKPRGAALALAAAACASAPTVARAPWSSSCLRAGSRSPPRRGRRPSSS